MITTVIFDLGNVLVLEDTSLVLPKFATYLTHPVEERKLEQMLYYFYHPPADETEVFFMDTHNKFHLGELSQRQFYETLKRKIGFRDSFTYEKFLALWPARYYRNNPVVAILKKLSRYTRYLMSDTNPLDASYLTSHFRDIFEQFDRVFYSYETRVDKKSQRAWDNILAESRGDPKTHIFIDDRSTYVEKARNLGMVGLLYTSPDALRKDLEKAGCRLVP